MNPQKEYEIDLNDPLTSRNYLKKISSNYEFGKLQAYEMGFETYTRDLMLANFMTKIYLQEVDTNFATKVICAMLFFGDALGT